MNTAVNERTRPHLETLNIAIPVPCVQGQFGNRLVTYSTQISPLQIRKVLGHDPRAANWKILPEQIREVYESIQRPTTKGRQNSIVRYIEDRLNRDVVGAFPAVSIGIMNHASFEPLDVPGLQRAVGILNIDEDSMRIMLDGLGRLSGALDLSEENAHGLALVKQCIFPVTFYCPAPGTPDLTLAEMGQLFSDFNFRVHPVSQRHAMALDSNDIYISMTNQLAQTPVIMTFGGMEVKASTLRKKSTALVVQSVLLRAVRGACEGREFQESNLAHPTSPNLTGLTFERELESIHEHFAEIAKRMGDRWARRGSLHLSAPGWQALGVLHHDINHRDLRLSDYQRDVIYDAIGEIDWARTGPQWSGEAHLGQVRDNGMTMTGAGRSNVKIILDFVRAKAGIKALLETR